MFSSPGATDNLVSTINMHCLGVLQSASCKDRLVDWLRDDLSQDVTTEVERVFDSPVTALALEDIEHRYLLSGTNNGSINIHDLYNLTGTVPHTAPAVAQIERDSRWSHKATVAEVSWYPPDTGMFLTSSSDRKLHVWDTNAMTRSETFKFDYKLIAHAMSPVASAHSLVAVCGEDPLVTLCDLRSGSSTHRLRGHAAASVDTCRWSPAHPHLLATGARDKQILFWDVRYSKGRVAGLSRRRRPGDPAHRAPVAGLRFVADGRHLVSVGRDGHVTLWDLLTGRPRQLTVPPLKVNNATDLGHPLAVTDSRGGRPLAFLPCSSQIVVCDLFPSSGSSSCCSSASDACPAPATRQRLDGHVRPVLACAYDPRRCRLLSAAGDGQLIVWSRRLTGQRPDHAQPSADAAAAAQSTEHLLSDAWSDDD